jgi:hypothetical protein
MKSSIETLHESGLLDTPPEERFDRLTRLAQALFQVPVALVSLVDSNRQWFKSRQGLQVSETPRDISFADMPFWVIRFSAFPMHYRMSALPIIRW